MSEFDRLSAKTVLIIRREAKRDGLDEVGIAWRIEAEAERAIVAKLADLLPGSYYMDPPDGGSVTVLEQFKRMADDARKWRDQAERVRLAIECERRCEG